MHTNDAMPAFGTAQLWVWELQHRPSRFNSYRYTYVAFWKEKDCPLVVATCVVNPTTQWVDWVEVTPRARRQGLATELLEGIAKHLGTDLRVCPISTKVSRGFCAAWKKHSKKRAR